MYVSEVLPIAAYCSAGFAVGCALPEPMPRGELKGAAAAFPPLSCDRIKLFIGGLLLLMFRVAKASPLRKDK